MTFRFVVDGAGETAWRRQRWLLLAVAVAAVQVGILWLVSAPLPIPPSPAPAAWRYRLLREAGPASPTSAAVDDLAWLLTPAVFLVPSVHDFSGAAWLGTPPSEVAIEAFSARWRQLEYRSVRDFPTGLSSIPRGDPGPGGQAAIPEGTRPVPGVPPVPLPAAGRVRILEGLGRWVLPERIQVPPIEDGRVPQSAVVRVMIDALGEPASPPVIWETSEEPGADEAAMRVVRGLRLKRRAPGPAAPGSPGFEWGLIAVAWPAPATTTNAAAKAHEP